jgi:hypothetical protein
VRVGVEGGWWGVADGAGFERRRLAVEYDDVARR